MCHSYCSIAASLTAVRSTIRHRCSSFLWLQGKSHQCWWIVAPAKASGIICKCENKFSTKLLCDHPHASYLLLHWKAFLAVTVHLFVRPSLYAQWHIFVPGKCCDPHFFRHSNTPRTQCFATAVHGCAENL